VTATRQGEETRARIVETAADLILAHGASATGLSAICAGTSTSKSQLFHYFPGGKAELVGAIAALQAERVLEAQRPHVDELDSWESWDAWGDAVLAHYAAQPHWGCPIGALSAEVAGTDPALAAELAGHMDRWRGYLQAGLERMLAAGQLAPDADPRALSLAVFAAVQGGLTLTRTMQTIEPLVAALDGALVMLRAAAVTERR
jgi:AcrR family transcriptional regulator